MIQNVINNYEGFTKKEVQKAILVCKFQAMIGNPYQKQFKKLVINKNLKNNIVTLADITNLNVIFGPYIPGMCWKTVRHQTTREETGYVGIPNDLYQFHKFVTLTEYVMFVNGVPFMKTIYRKIRLFTSEHIPSHTAYQISISLS